MISNKYIITFSILLIFGSIYFSNIDKKKDALELFKQNCSSRVCVSPYTIHNRNNFYGLVPHMGILVYENKKIKSYSLSKSGYFNTPDLLLEGGTSRRGKLIEKGFNLKLLGIRSIHPNYLDEIPVNKKFNYSIFNSDNEHNCASIVSELFELFGFPMKCYLNFYNYIITPEIPFLCSFI